MNAFLKQLTIQIKMDIRDKGTFLVFYIVPLVFYMVMGAVFASINPEMKQTLSATMAIFSITMGAVIGIPPSIVKIRETNVFPAYKVNGIPGNSVMMSLGISAFIHLFIVSLIITISSPIIFGADIPQNMIGFVGVLIMILICSVILGLLVGLTAKSQASAMMLSQGIFLPSLMLSGIMFPSDMLPNPLMYAGEIFPATQAMKAFSSLAYGKTLNSNSMTPLMIIFGIGLAASLFMAWRFDRITRVS